MSRLVPLAVLRLPRLRELVVIGRVRGSGIEAEERGGALLPGGREEAQEGVRRGLVQHLARAAVRHTQDVVPRCRVAEARHLNVPICMVAPCGGLHRGRCRLIEGFPLRRRLRRCGWGPVGTPRPSRVVASAPLAPPIEAMEERGPSMAI